ncbi:flagella synthesis protein FlgN [Solimicrobium silvestre]|uniref:Flagellar biosynthesis/type III secretory pathway chaperone n=1 Tax=Solimicrobium silvestre TaxID=2099400 RepID=A0A2S9GVT5_9BURK|nr:flagellar protein FlgN [Solimicrobium silvestre]PRC91833.1 Flagellar biosynthesis/type III secretory pathway chaperone [Solimicrobium silvestre]
MNTLLFCIQNETDAMTALVEVLGQEQTALTQAPSLPLMEEINAVMQRKNQLIASISQLGHTRKNELTRLGFKHPETSMPEWLQDQAQVECWAKLMKLTRKAKELNRVNGLLITKHLIRNQSTLQVLYQNHGSTSTPSLYGANGQSNTQRSTVRGFIAI